MMCQHCKRKPARKKFCSDKCKGRFYAKHNKEKLNATKSAWIENNPQYYKEYWRDYRKNKAVKNASSHTELEKIFMKGVKY